jgi:DNA-binding transcriptional LysR family regulator
MELRHLRYFSALAEELHFGRAAARLFITQPPLSFNIKQLEDELGVSLLERDNKRVVLTQAGRAFYAEAMAILSKADRACALARSVGRGSAGRLDVGFSGSLIYSELGAILEAYKHRWPEVEVVLHENVLTQQVEALEHRNLDLGFVGFDSAAVPQGFSGLLLREDRYVCCLPEDHPLSDRREIRLKELADEVFVTFSRQGAPATYDRLLGMCLSAGLTPKITYTVRQWLTILALVAEKFGVSLVPERMSNTGMSGVVFVPISDAYSVTSCGFLIWIEEQANERVRSFVECARDVIRALPGGADAVEA